MTWVNDLGCSRHHAERTWNPPRVVEVDVAADLHPAEPARYYEVADADPPRLRGEGAVGLYVCHPPLEEVLADCWNWTEYGL